ncbi:unnamed protein product [Lactuca virosa]|uniref:Uncharacterized protein n=1 Tax=Lactuca virosa TaxID=75947 RepID=A0AAU9PQI6_9ASTR|nr:unnamed protein product [Lactuca virosa]
MVALPDPSHRLFSTALSHVFVFFFSLPPSDADTLSTGLAAGSNTACLEPELLETRRLSLSRLPPIPFSTSIRYVTLQEAILDSDYVKFQHTVVFMEHLCSKICPWSIDNLYVNLSHGIVHVNGISERNKTILSESAPC